MKDIYENKLPFEIQEQIIEKLAQALNKDSQNHITINQIKRALMIYYSELYDFDIGLDFLKVKISYIEVLEFLKNYNFKINDLEIDSSIGSIDHFKLIFKRVMVKSNNIRLVVHKNDVDPFPSSPHAHNLDNNLKLHLGNGIYYKKREQIGSINKKELIKIRLLLEPKLKNIGLSLPPLEKI